MTYVTSGLGGMSSQAKAAVIAGATSIIAEVNLGRRIQNAMSKDGLIKLLEMSMMPLIEW